MTKTLKEFKEQTKDLTPEQLSDYLKNLSDEDYNFILTEINKEHRINYVFKYDDFRDYTTDEKEINKRMIDIKEAISNYKQEDLDYTKESLYNPNILRVLSSCIKDTDADLDEDRLNKLIARYNAINDFIYSDLDYNRILGYYNDIVKSDYNGFYKTNDAIARKILLDNNFDVSEDDLEPFKERINLLWEDKTEILNPNEINDLSEKHNGINFKQFIFCEEYLKRGKIKPTCEHLGISRNTAYTWLDDKKVQDYLNNRKDEIKQETDAMYLSTYRACFNELQKMISSNHVEHSDKIRAIGVYLRHYENIERVKTPPHSP